MKSEFRKELEQRSDKELIELYKESSDLLVLSILYKRYSHLVYGLCLKYLNREDSKDAVMNIYEELIIKVKKYPIENFNSWIHVTSRNHCLMILRKRKRQNSEPLIMELATNEHPIDEDPMENDLNALKKCMEKLPEGQKQCIQLFFLDKMSYVKISEHLELEVKKVKSYLQNAKRNLKICIEKHRE